MRPAPSAIARVERAIDASPEQVFDAWLNPDLIGRWMFGRGVRDEDVLSIGVDGQVGGKFSFLVRRQGQEFDHVGTYQVLDRPRRLVFTWAVEEERPDTASRVTLEIHESGFQGSRVVLTHELLPGWADFRQQSEESWGKMLDQLNKVLTGPLVSTT